MAQRRIAREKREFGSLYKGREGQWSWVAHRVTGVAIILFLFAHVVDTALIGWGPNAYNRVIHVYQNPAVGMLELGLVAAVVWHALNGIKIMVIDFWPKASDHHRQLIYGTVVLFVASMLPIAVIMIRHILKEHFWWPSARTGWPLRSTARTASGPASPTGPGGSRPGEAPNSGGGSSCGSPASCCWSWRWGTS